MKHNLKTVEAEIQYEKGGVEMKDQRRYDNLILCRRCGGPRKSVHDDCPACGLRGSAEPDEPTIRDTVNDFNQAAPRRFAYAREMMRYNGED